MEKKLFEPKAQNCAVKIKDERLEHRHRRRTRVGLGVLFLKPLQEVLGDSGRLKADKKVRLKQSFSEIVQTELFEAKRH